MAEDDSNILAILLETGPLFWDHLQDGDLDPRAFIEQLLAFVRTCTLLNVGNQLAVFAAGTAGSTLLFATPGCAPYASTGSTEALSSSTLFGASDGDPTEAVLTQLQHALRREAAASSSWRPESAFSSALSRALCFVNKFQRAGGEGRQAVGARVLCLVASPDAPPQYIAIMNAIFAAQRSQVVIDACKLGEGHSSFLQQAADLTKGVYLRPPKPAALIEYLLTAYTADVSSRQFLRLPQPSAVDFRASCFCHKQPTDLGYVCSVCLSIFCGKVPACTTCGTDFSKAPVALKPS